MRRPQDFKGIHVPVISCFQGKEGRGPVDEKAQKKLIEYLLTEQQIDGIIACATTGEAPSLNEQEYLQLAKLTLTEARGIRKDCIVMLGTTSLDARVVLEKNKLALDLGFDGVLLSHPPYLKPDQRGIYAFFREAAAATPNLPIFIYNIWYRTGGKGIDAKTIIELAKIPNIYGIKDCGVSLDHTDEVIANTRRDEFLYFTGEDAVLFDTLTHGGDGAIFATAHILSKEMQQMLSLIKAGNREEALCIHRKIKPMIAALFSEPNPAPLKCLLNLMGLEVGEPRGPTLLKATEPTEKLLQSLNNQKTSH